MRETTASHSRLEPAVRRAQVSYQISPVTERITAAFHMRKQVIRRRGCAGGLKMPMLQLSINTVLGPGQWSQGHGANGKLELVTRGF